MSSASTQKTEKVYCIQKIAYSRKYYQGGDGAERQVGNEKQLDAIAENLDSYYPCLFNQESF